mgnify:CR=1 FL=1
MANLLPVKPLFSLLVKAFLQFGELSMIITSQVYSLIYGPEVIRLLGSSVFDRVQLYQNRGATVKIVATFLLVNQAAFLFCYSLQLGTQWAWPPTLDSATANLVLYSVGANNFFYFHLLLYLEYGTSVVFRSLNNDTGGVLQNQKGGNSVDLVTGQFRALALVHDRLLSLIAFPFSYLVMVSFLNAINCACMLTMFYSGNPWELVFILYPAIIWGYFVLLVVLNRRNLAAFDSLVKQLVKPKKENSRLQKGSLFGGRSLSVFDLQEQYRRCFQLRLFHLVSVDLAFAFAATLLALNFIVFLVQTK